jgi:RNA polymerase sigma-70 factor, ECF subfamily
MSLWVESRRSSSGEVAAFELLWERHSQAIYRRVSRVLGKHRSLADEVFQDAWLEVSRATAYAPGSFRSFIRTVATRKALDRLAAVSLRAAVVPIGHSEDGEDGPAMLPLAAAKYGPDRDAEARERVGVVLRTIARLPRWQGHAWSLRYVEELTFEEIAAATRVPVGTAKTRVRLANASLADALEKQRIETADLEVDG